MNQRKLTPLILIVFVVIMILGIAMLFVNMTNDSLWYDESYTAAIVNQPALDIITISGGDSHPPLYYLLLKPICLLFGTSVFVLRLFSVLGTAALASLGIGPVRRAIGTRAGILFTLLTFLLPIAIAMSHEARMYTWSAFFVTGSALYGYMAQRDGQKKEWVLFIVLSVAAAYLHYYALLAVVMIFAVMLVYCMRDRKKRIPFLIAAGIFIASYLPWGIMLAGQVSRVAGSFWIPEVTGKIILSVFAYPFGYKFPDVGHLTTGIIAFAVCAVWIVWGIIYSIRKKEADMKMPILAAGVYLLTIAAGIVASAVIRPVLVERYMVPVLGLYLLALVYGLATNRRMVLLVIATCVVAGLCIPSAFANMTQRVNGPMKEVAAKMADQVEPGDVFLHTDEHTYGTFCYYFPNQKHYYYEREGYEGYSNFDAFKQNGIMIDGLDEIQGNPRVWLVQRPYANDKYSATQWITSKALKVEQTLGSFSIPNSWYAVSVMRVSIGDLDALKENKTPALAESGKLSVQVNCLRSDTGNVMVLLYNQAPMAQEPYLIQTGSIQKGKAEVTFTDLPYGEYSLLAVHDENGNSTVDMNGDVPSEGVGYSNSTAPPTGPPDFEFCKFRFDSADETESVSVHYMN